jgi:beta-phosphoglucomutase-like phosphatase (HAD superfamily)
VCCQLDGVLIDAAAHHRHELDRVLKRPIGRALLRRLQRHAHLGRAERPNRGHRLRRRERRIDRDDRLTVRADPPQPLARHWMADRHHRAKRVPLNRQR